MNFNELDLAILKTLLTNKKFALEFAHECNEKVFEPDLWRFSKLILDYIRLFKQPPTKRVILERVGSNKNEVFLESINQIFSKLDTLKYNDNEYKHDLEKIKTRFSEKLLHNLKDTLSTESVDIKKSMNEIQSVLTNIKSVNQTKIYKDGSLADYATDFSTMYAAKLQNPEVDAGVKTGYSGIDYATGGLKAGELLLFAGITASGKSLMLVNTGIQMWMGENSIEMTDHFKKGCNVLLFSLEMNYEDCMMRCLARIAMVPQRSLRDATLTDEEKDRVKKAFKFIKAYPHSFRVIDLPRKATAEKLELIINEQSDAGHKPDVVIIDYLNLMGADVGSDQSDWLVQSAIAEQVHELARVKELILLSAVQLNPKTNDKDGGGVKSFRRATQIADNADFIIIINTRPDEKRYPDFSYSIVKNRRGELIDGKLRKEMPCCALLDQGMGEGINGDIEDISSLICQ